MTPLEPHHLSSIYSPLDTTTIALSSRHHVPVIGGTALEMLVRHHQLPVKCPRSVNNIDFVCSRHPSADRAGFQRALL